MKNDIVKLPMKCPTCGKWFISQKALNGHVKVHRPDYVPRFQIMAEAGAAMYAAGVGLASPSLSDDVLKIIERAWREGCYARAKRRPSAAANDGKQK